MDLRVVVRVDGADHDVVVRSGPGHLVAEVAAALAEHFRSADRRLSCLRLGGPLDPGAEWGGCRLRHGDRLELADSGRVDVPRSSSAVRLVIVGGPASGTSVALGQGRHVVGRGPGADVELQDTFASRRHFAVDVDGSSVRLTDQRSSNGTFVEGTEIADGQLYRLGETVEFGSSLVVFEPVATAVESPSLREADGHVLFSRPPRMRPPVLEEAVQLPAPPTLTGRARIPIQSALAPLLMAAVYLLIPGQHGASVIVMAASGGLSAVLAVGSVLSGSLGGRRRFRRRQAEFRRDLVTAREMAAAGFDREQRLRRAAHPAPDVLLRRVSTVADSLWERRTEDPDFLTLRVGFGDAPALRRLEVSGEGAPHLRAEVEELAQRYAVSPAVPITVDLTKDGVLGIVGPGRGVSALGSWLVVQAAVEHSPKDLHVCAVVPDDPSWRWIARLPHANPNARLFDAPLIAPDRGRGEVLVDRLGALVRSRSDARSGLQRVFQPSVLVVLDGSTGLAPSMLEGLLRDGPSVGVFTIWLGDVVRHLPGHCRVYVDIEGASVVHPGAAQEQRLAGVDAVSDALCAEVAGALMGVADVAAASAVDSIPRVAPLLDLVDGDVTAAGVVERWSSWTDAELSATLGQGVGGPFRMSLRRDGPHALIGGTTGAGKSELLQALIASLALNYAPTQLNFLLVDYKGGAAFKDCAKLPHTVGLVTDLDGGLVRRALTSLNAELHRREAVLKEANVKDQVDMELRHTAAALPNLVVVVDEFATLAKELPEFVDGVVDIAQRGRSLGIHLVLATQRPHGAINDNIRGNTNLRIALRVADEADSNDIIGVRDAAALSRDLPGRAYARTGHSEVTAFQTAYVGGHTFAAVADEPGVEILDVSWGEVVRRGPERRVARAEPTDLEVIVEACNRAADQAGIPRQRSPWLPPLPRSIDLESLVGEGGSGGGAAFALADYPERQAQSAAMWCPDDTGSLLVFGGGGSGKSTALRTLLASMAIRNSPSDVHLYGLDFAGHGLAPLGQLPHCGAVIDGDDRERIDRLLDRLVREVRDRRALLAARGATSIAELASRDQGHAPARIVVAMDGFDGFVAQYERLDYGGRIDELPRLINDGRPVGIYFAISVTRRGAASLALVNAVPDRLVLAMSDEDDYASLGLGARLTRGVDLPPGRGFHGTDLVQVAVVGADPRGHAQLRHLELLASRLAARYPQARVPGVHTLPEHVDLASLQAVDPGAVGVDDLDLSVVAVCPADGSLLVVGPRRSGRTNAIAAIATALRSDGRVDELHLICSRREAVATMPVWSSVAVGGEAAGDLIRALLDAPAGKARFGDRRKVLFIDDAEELSDYATDDGLVKLLRSGDDRGVSIIAATDTQFAHRAFGGWLSELKRLRRALILQPDLDLDGDLIAAKLPRTATRWVPGRGFLADSSGLRLVQIAREA